MHEYFAYESYRNRSVWEYIIEKLLWLIYEREIYKKIRKL